MRAVVQRVKECSVRISGTEKSRISFGLLVYLGIGGTDTEEDLRYLAEKVINLRVFQDDQGKMNLSAADLGAEFMVVSQFTLFGDVRKGRRPSYTGAAEPGLARDFYERFILELRARGCRVESGEFAASMEVSYVNLGPVTILIDTRATALRPPGGP